MTSCTAVGIAYPPQGPGDALAEEWNGHSWSILPTPAPAGAIGSSLSGVSCFAASACTAVGNYAVSASSEFALVERWNGQSWSIQQVEPPAGGQGALFGVSCGSVSTCMAVGSASPQGVASVLVERWDGSAWTIQQLPTPSYVAFFAVSCTSAVACVVVGYSVAEGWNGTAWHIQPTPTAPIDADSYLQGVSCTSATACVAVGYYLPGDTQAPDVLVERYS
jgi:hypothetical protein